MTNNKDLPTSARLVNGSRLLGQLWRDGIRCQDGWRAKCDCENPTRFCRAKVQWASMVATVLERRGGDDVFSGTDFEIVEAMTGQELVSSGLTLNLEVPGFGRLKVGPKGDVGYDVVAAASQTDIMGLKAILAVIKKFPGSKVVSRDG